MKTKENNEVKVNIAEILRYAPKMLELFSPIYGEVYFDYVNEEGTDIRVKTKLCGGSVATFNANGTFYDLPNSECLLFPSVNHRCWNNWQNTLFLESIGSVCVHNITGNKFILGEDGTYFDDNSRITGSPFHFLIDGANACNYLLDSRYATPEEAKEFFEELEKNGYEWDGKKVVKKGNIKPKFKVGDLIRHKDTGIFFAIAEVKDDCYYSKGKTCLLFKYQDNWELAASKANLSLEDKVSILADEIIALKERVKALEIQVIKDISTPPLTKDPYFKSSKITCDLAEGKDKTGIQVYATPDKAGDNVTLKDMKS